MYTFKKYEDAMKQLYTRSDILLQAQPKMIALTVEPTLDLQVRPISTKQKWPYSWFDVDLPFSG